MIEETLKFPKRPSYPQNRHNNQNTPKPIKLAKIPLKPPL